MIQKRRAFSCRMQRTYLHLKKRPLTKHLLKKRRRRYPVHPRSVTALRLRARLNQATPMKNPATALENGSNNKRKNPVSAEEQDQTTEFPMRSQKRLIGENLFHHHSQASSRKSPKQRCQSAKSQTKDTRRGKSAQTAEWERAH